MLSRAYHIRPQLSDAPFSTSTFSFLPRHHPILLRHVDHVRNQISAGVSLHTAAAAATNTYSSTVRTSTNEDIQRSNIVQQLLTNISTSVGMDEILTFNVGNSNQQSNG